MISGPPKISPDYQQKYLVRETETLKINCPVESNPAPLVNWKKDDQTIHLGWGRFRLAGNVMRIKNVEWEDTGVYVCKATNGFGSIEATFFIYVYGEQTKIFAN